MRDARRCGRGWAWCAAVLVACGSGGKKDDTVASAAIGAAGGTVSLARGASLEVPPGALAETKTITVTRSTAQAPDGALTPVFEFGPAGTTFAAPVTVSFAVPAGSAAGSIYWTLPGSTADYDTLATAVAGTTATAQVRHFSSGFFGARCVTDEACTPANACREGKATCNKTPRCVETAVAVADGKACGNGNACVAGTCQPPCVAGAACTPDAPAACKAYATACSGAIASCLLSGDAPDGTPCGAGLACAGGACVAPPAPPTAVTAFPANGAATVSWAPSAGATGYHVYFSSTPAVARAGTPLSVAAPPASVPGANGTAIYVAVAALNAAGESALSAASCAVPTAAASAGLTLLDPLCEARLDGQKWLGPGVFSSGVSGGAAALSVDVADQESRALRNVNYQVTANVAAGSGAAGQRVTTLQAGLRVPAASAALTGGSALRAGVRLLYSPPALRLNFPAQNQDLLQLEVGVIDVGAGPHVYRQVSHCDDASCAALSAAQIAFADPAGLQAIGSSTVQAGLPAAYDTTYTVTARLDEAAGVFHWSIAGGAFTVPLTGTADAGAYLAATPSWSGVPLAGAGFQSGQLVARTQDNSAAGGGSGAVTALFDDVRVGYDDAAAAPYDAFDGTAGNSGPTELSPAKWSNGGRNSAALAGGALVMHDEITGSGLAPVSAPRTLALSHPDQANTLQADVSIPSFQGAIGGAATAQLQGRFLNDGSAAAAPSSAVGDVLAILLLDAQANSARWSLGRCATPTCTGALGSVGFGTFGGATVGASVHTLRLQWDPAAKLFTFTLDGQAVTVDPTRTGAGGVASPVAAANPAMSPMRQIVSNVGVGNAAGPQTGSVDVRVNNVFVAP